MKIPDILCELEAWGKLHSWKDFELYSLGSQYISGEYFQLSDNVMLFPHYKILKLCSALLAIQMILPKKGYKLYFLQKNVSRITVCSRTNGHSNKWAFFVKKRCYLFANKWAFEQMGNPTQQTLSSGTNGHFVTANSS